MEGGESIAEMTEGVVEADNIGEGVQSVDGEGVHERCARRYRLESGRLGW